jgi:hypothetical protein
LYIGDSEVDREFAINSGVDYYLIWDEAENSLVFWISAKAPLILNIIFNKF